MQIVAKIFQIIIYWPTYSLLKFFTHYKVKGQENLKDLKNGAIIFASNHNSYIDGPICAAAMPRDGFKIVPWNLFPIRFLVYKEFFSFKNRFFFPISLFVTMYVYANGSLKVFRAKGDLETALSDTVRALKDNRSRVWMYPEGKISPDGKVQRGKRGIAYLHQRTKAPIVPVGINGSFGFSFLNFFLRRRNVKVRIGKPIYSLEGASLEEGVEIIMQKIDELVD